MEDFEKLGAFYLGRRYDLETDELTDELTLYDSKDLTTHGVIIGMTGSGKTGLGIGLIEEAALDRVPVIAVDPKGDLGNLLLTFPNLAPEDFEPWIDPAVALESGKTPAEQAAATAQLWRDGLGKWDQTPARIERLRAAAAVRILTPGSTVGTPVSVLKTFAIDPALKSDGDALRERIQSTVQSLLTLLDIDADPLTSREHILLSNILDDCWSRGASLSLPELIAAVQNPPVTRVGVLELETFYPSAERFELAMRINNLLAAPGFAVWTQGVPLNIADLLYTESGQPRVTILSIAHLGDAERMFFVTALLAELVSWMRLQSGTGSLRALFYMDEVFGYLPPVSNPPCKPLMLTLLKQARAYGLGLVLATQNPVDLDYKALSNIGTWMIGRLQTRRDIDRIRSGLEAAAGAGNLEGRMLDAALAGMRKRCFLLHNVHDTRPEIFHTRWVMSYLAGPLTADAIRRLTPQASDAVRESLPDIPEQETRAVSTQEQAPLLDPSIRQFFVSLETAGAPDASEIYAPWLLVAANIRYSRVRPPVESERRLLLVVPPASDGKALVWERAAELAATLEDLSVQPPEGAQFTAVPAMLSKSKQLEALGNRIRRWLRERYALTMFRSATHKCYSDAGESEGEFRVRLQELGNQQRDSKIAVLRKRYESRLTRLTGRLERANRRVEKEGDQARAHRLDTAVTFGTAILGALLGRKTVSATSANRVGSAIRKAGRSREQSADVDRARAAAAAVQEEIDTLSA
ncbi:MAG TPA: DUF87 domain-containing protein, partial [Gammaproteobacteria bacterium]|nr:DUF87 domain-containing protein [Gammaproteobacteria bacterium]